MNENSEIRAKVLEWQRRHNIQDNDPALALIDLLDIYDRQPVVVQVQEIPRAGKLHHAERGGRLPVLGQVRNRGQAEHGRHSDPLRPDPPDEQDDGLRADFPHHPQLRGSRERLRRRKIPRSRDDHSERRHHHRRPATKYRVTPTTSYSNLYDFSVHFEYQDWVTWFATFGITPSGGPINSKPIRDIGMIAAEEAYMISLQWLIGGEVGYAVTSDYNEGTIGLFARYFFEPRNGLPRTDLGLDRP
jgi:hypothetical protein